MGQLEYRILGPLEIADGGRPVELTAQKQRALLACLLLWRNQPVPSDVLVDALWRERPPPSASKLVQVYVSQLRRALGPGAVETRRSGYLLRADPEDVDAVRFERLLSDAREALAAGNGELAASLCRRALALWRGPALVEFGDIDAVATEARRVDDLRVACLELRIEADLALGRHEAVLAELVALVREHPLRERLRAHLMVALYRAGRQADALAAYQEARRALRDELGLEPGTELRELQRAILRQDDAVGGPVLEAHAKPVLPAAMTPLVGRRRELAQLGALVRARDARLITLVGAGGTGKTRLALATAEACADAFANGCAVVELAALADPELVLPTIARELAVPERPSEPIATTLARWLAPRELLVVLDNLEHLAAAFPALVALVAAAPRLTLLVTSRRVLHVSGEHVLPVHPLDEEDAVELFAQRARASAGDVDSAVDTEPVVREICRRLDCLPLAIELAAARTATLRPRALLERLTRRLTLLTAGPRDLPARQQTLRETLDWSANLLSDRERRALVGVALFPAGSTLEAAEAVSGADLDTISALVDHSVVQRVDRDGEPRFTLLETVREYALEQLVGDVDVEELQTRYVDWYLRLAETAERELIGDRQTFWFATLEVEHDNLRSALTYLAGAGDPESRLRLTIALTRFWYVRGYLSEARRWLEHALEEGGDQPLALRRRALTAASAVALLQGDYPAATRLAEQSLELAEATDEPTYVANALSNLGAIVLAAGDHGRAASLLERAVPLAREAGDTRIAALAVNNLGDLALTVGDYEAAEALFEESLELLRERGDTANIARALFNLGAVALMLGRHGEAARRLRQSLELSDTAGDKEDVAWCLEGFAALAASGGDGERAARLLGAAASILETMGAALKPFERQLHESTEAAARAACGNEAFDAAYRRGKAMTVEDACDDALGGTPTAAVR